MSVTIITRANWGARSPRTLTPLEHAIQQGTAVHYTGMDADEQDNHVNCAKRVQGIQNYHMDGKGWADIAYSFLACKHGACFVGRGTGMRTAAQGTSTGNDAYHAVCFLGNDSINRDDVTDLGRAALAWAIAYCNSWSGKQRIEPHSFFKSTECPGDQLRKWIVTSAKTPPKTMPPEAPPIRGVPLWPGRYLQLKPAMMHGTDVRMFQQRMKNRGWRLAVDGWFGRETSNVVHAFQKEKGLIVDGIVGPVTWRAAWTLPVT